MEHELHLAEFQGRRQAIASAEHYETALIDRDSAIRDLKSMQRAYDMGAYPIINVLRAKDSLARAEIALTRARRMQELDAEQLDRDLNERNADIARQRRFVAELEAATTAAAENPTPGQSPR